MCCVGYNCVFSCIRVHARAAFVFFRIGREMSMIACTPPCPPAGGSNSCPRSPHDTTTALTFQECPPQTQSLTLAAPALRPPCERRAGTIVTGVPVMSNRGVTIKALQRCAAICTRALACTANGRGCVRWPAAVRQFNFFSPACVAGSVRARVTHPCTPGARARHAHSKAAAPHALSSPPTKQPRGGLTDGPPTG